MSQAPGRRCDSTAIARVDFDARGRGVLGDDVPMAVLKGVGAEAPWSDELARAVQRAGWIGRRPDGPETVSFTSLFLGILASDDATSRWASETAREIGPREQAILERWAASAGPLARREVGIVGEASAIPIDKVVANKRTPSATRVLNEAARLADGAGAVDVRHVLAVYIYRPGEHREDLDGWRLDRRRWSRRFQEFVRGAYPDEVDRWSELRAAERLESLSAGVQQALEWACAVARRRSKAELDAELLLAGVLLDGMVHRESETTASRFARAVADEILPLLELPSLPPQSRRNLPLGPEAAEIFDQADELASDASDRQVHVRHLVAALLARRDGTADEILRKADRTRAQLVRSLIGSLSASVPESDEEMALWLPLLADSAVGLPRLASVDNDEAHGDDLLGVERDARAFAGVLASRDLVPPLSVGLFGDWGSGKSFFMRLLRGHIETLAAASREAGQASTRFCDQIRQIEFNAWHYMDANLWASLVTHVFDDLNEHFGSEKRRPIEEYAARLASVEERRREIEADRDALERRTEALEGEIRALQGERARRTLSFRDLAVGVAREVADDERVRSALDAAAARLGLPEARLSLEDARRRRDHLRGLAGRVGEWFQLMRRRPAQVVVALCITLLPPALAAVLGWGADLLQPAAAKLAAALAAVAGLLASLVSQTSPIASRIDAALDRAADVERALRSRQGERELKLLEEQAQIAASEAKLEQERIALVQRQIELQAEIEGLKRGRSFKKFVLERAASDDYRKQLGVIASAHRDFQELAALLGQDDPPHLDRIILYIDDLDRCPPRRVVEVLQAIHLLLSLKLFIVVVAVDSHWLLQSLEAYYAEQFKDVPLPAEARPQKYLEKIFQIPFTIPPMNDLGFSSLVGGLLGRDAPPVPPSNVASPPPPPSSTPDQVLERAAQSPPPDAPPTAPPPTPRAPAGAGARPRPRKHTGIDLLPRNLEIPPAEIAHLASLRDIVQSPRAAKRLVNLYRIIRARLDGDALDWFETTGYRPTQLCLALTVGYPTLAAQLFAAMFSRKITSRASLRDFLRDLPPHTPPVWNELSTLIRRHDALLSDWASAERAALSVAPYSFETGRVLRTLRTLTAPPPPPA